MESIIIIVLADILCIMVYGVSVNISDRTLRTMLRYIAFLLLIFTGMLLNRFNEPIVMVMFAIVNVASVIAISYFNKRNKAQIDRKQEELK